MKGFFTVFVISPFSQDISITRDYRLNEGVAVLKEKSLEISTGSLTKVCKDQMFYTTKPLAQIHSVREPVAPSDVMKPDAY